jgi:ABC-2 type transport system ATP-binding protein
VAEAIMSQDAVIRTAGLVKTYQEGWFRRRAYQALRGVDLEVRPREIFGLLGPNGAGKTTLIKILLGILHPSGGKATVLGQPAGSLDARRRIGYLPENMVFPRHHTGHSALQFYGRLNGLSEEVIRQREPELLEMVGLRGREGELVRKYSKGMRQRLGLAQAMIHQPDILIMDEPTDGLDPVGRSQIREVIERLREMGKTVFLNSHILQEVELVCDRVAIMAKGKLRRLGTVAELTEVSGSDAGALTILRVMASPEQVAAIRASGSPEPPPVRVLPLTGGTDGELSLELSDGSQPSLDRWIDLLRSHSISIVAVERKKPRLEDVFMQTVDRSSSPESSPETMHAEGEGGRR